MKKVEVQVYDKSRNELPKYATDFSAGLDLMADIEGDDRLIIFPGERRLIPTGLHVAIPEGFEIQIRPRSGLSLKKGIGVLNSPGTVDSDYRGEIGVILLNTGSEAIRIANGERIAQAVLCEVPQIKWNKVEKITDLSSTERGEGGFGSTGVHSETNTTTNIPIEYILPQQDNTLKNSDPTKFTE
jgi:dUTP pyrophosphatase